MDSALPLFLWENYLTHSEADRGPASDHTRRTLGLWRVIVRFTRLLIPVTSFLLFLRPGVAFGQGTDSFTVNVPKKITSPFLPITTVKTIVALENPTCTANVGGCPANGSGSVTFTLTDENGTSNAVACSPTSCTPTASSTICPEGLPWVCFALPVSETGAQGPDHVKVYPVSGPTDDPVRYEIDILLWSNFKFGTQNNCINTQFVNLNSYTVQISSAGGNKIMGVCLESFDGLQRPQNTNGCTTQNWNAFEIPIPLDDPN